MRNGFVPLWVLVLVLLALLFAPIPFRYGRVICAQPLVYPGKYTPCPKQLIIGWNPSIAQILYKRIRVQNLGKPETNDIEEKFCGGIAANLPENQCPKGYNCQLEGNYPDAGGKCVKD